LVAEERLANLATAIVTGIRVFFTSVLLSLLGMRTPRRAALLVVAE
jgi:hypothetical protein